ncbi:hypothetical protein B296_00012010 [Ensete ventricosum]|uniref:Uncharacterized protein n=1 Tax=Ensete ventricosum TaxID=4639 RepID=A0A426YEB2_ENSVE|nr:hypothetical protein B296_00012010 [Ensete ventricosum]
MVDTNSSVDILYKDAFQKLGLTMTDLSPLSSTLTGFIGASIAPLEMIVLLVTLSQEPRSKTLVFLTIGGVGEARGDPWESTHCYLTAVTLPKKARAEHSTRTETVTPAPSSDQPLVDP